jgi:hypothetical protein
MASFKRNQYGFTVGGPVVRDHVFFFVNYEALRQRSVDQTSGTVPTALERSGDFSQSRQVVAGNCVPVQLYDPITTRANPSGGYIRDPFPNAIIPSSRFDPVGKNIVKYFPDPNSPGAACTGATNFRSVMSTPTNSIEVDGKFDWIPSEKTRMSLGLGWRSYVQDPANHYGNIAAPTLTSDNIPARSLRMEYNRTQSATLLFQGRFGITRLELAKWFDTGIFSQPATFTFGNGPRTMPNLRADGTRSWDSSVFKTFPIHESIRAEFRAEMFNFTNTPNFAAPGQGFGTAIFGSVTSQANSPRQVQLGLKLYY